MAKGKDWTLTDKRLKECLTMLNSQHTVGSIASHFRIHRDTLATKLSESGVDTGALRNAGKLALRAMAFDSIMNIKDSAKRSDSALRYLNQYPIKDEVTTDNDHISDVAIRDSILGELNG